MSRLSDLLRQVESNDEQLAADLRAEFEQLRKRRAFGLNFERHVPETVELPGRPVRKGDKVRFLAERGQPAHSVDRRLWQVTGFQGGKGTRVAKLARRDAPDDELETASRRVEDLVVVAEFRDPIFPGLRSTGKIERGGDKPFHSVINAENYHALQALLYTHEGKVDAIYIDPPYNSGARDWKYNNDYVDGEDAYRHSKWLAMMERRLKLAKRLLNPADSILIVTIDEKEYLRLGLLLEQTFPDGEHQMISTIIKPEGTNRVGGFSRSNEFVFFVRMGSAVVQHTADDMSGRREDVSNDPIEWRNLRRREKSSVRSARPNQFYPIFVDAEKRRIHSIGDQLDYEVTRDSVTAPEETVAVFPLKPDGTEMLWGLTPDGARYRLRKGYLRTSASRNGEISIQYLAKGTVDALEGGRAVVTRRDDQGAVQGHFIAGTATPKSQWNKDSHNAQTSGTLVLNALLASNRFNFPKSLYAVEDALRFFIADKPDAFILDFFAGSGTTAHAVMRLNKQDGGRRQCISVTNNEVSADEQKGLREQGLRPGDADWEALGICDYITKPRIEAAITGRTPDGEPIKGDYKFTDAFPMADGFEENVEFFTLTYEAPRPVAHHRAFEAIAPLLWLKAGAQGWRIENPDQAFDVAEVYGVLFDLDAGEAFIEALQAQDEIRMAFIITDDDRGYQAVCAELPERVEAVRLYESYLSNFTINSGRD